MALKIKNMNPKVVLHYVIVALRSGPFIDNLCMTPLAIMDELRQWATKFLWLEEMRKYRNNIRAETMLAEKIWVNRDSTQRNSSHQREPKPTRFSRYTPLSVPKSRVLGEVLQVDLIPSPRKFKNPPMLT